MDPEEKGLEEELEQGAAPEAEAEGDGAEAEASGGAERDAQLAESDDPMRAEAQAYAASQGYEERLTDKEVAEYAETKRLEETSPDPSDAPDVEEIEAADEGEAVPEAEAGEGMGGLEGAAGGGGPAAGAAVPVQEAKAEPVAVETSDTGGAGAGPMPLPVTDTNTIHELTCETPEPVTTSQTQGMIDAVDTTASTQPNVSESKAEETGFMKNLVTGMGDSLLGPLMPGFDGRRSEDVKGIDKAWQGANLTSWTGARNGVDAVYRGIDLVTKYTGPLATILGVASLIRYLVFLPACVAIGNFFKVVATFLNTLNTILDLVKFALSGVKAVLGVFAVAGAVINQDPKAFDEALNNLIGDTVEFGANGFAIAMGGIIDAKVTGGSWKDGLKDAFSPKKAVSDFAKSTRGLASGTAQGFKAAYGGGKWKMADGWFQPSLEAGEATFRDATGQGTEAALTNTANTYLKFKAGQGTTIASSIMQEGTRDRNGEAEGGVYWDVSGLGAQLFGTPTTAETREAGTSVGQAMADAQASLVQQAETSDVPLTQGPALPDTTPSAPHHVQAIQGERENLKERRAQLEAQKVAAQAGQEEGQAIQEAADIHVGKVADGKQTLGEAKAKREEEKGAVATERQTAGKAKEEGAKGKSKMLEGKNGPGGAPSDSSTSVPWYKKPFVGMIRKVNAAKAKVMGKIQGAITNAVMGAAGFDDMDGNIAEGEKNLDAQDAVLAGAPAKFGVAEQVADKETGDAEASKSEAATQQAENQALEAEVDGTLSQLDGQEAALEAEEAKVEGEKATFDATYGPTVDEINELAEKQKNEEMEPMQLLLDEQVQAVQEAVDELTSVLQDHEGAMEGDADEKAAALTDALDAVDGLNATQKGMVEEAAAGTKDVVMSEATQFTAELQSELDGLLSEAGGFSGQVASKEKLAQLGDLCGRVAGMATAIEEGRSQQMVELNGRFRETYDSLVGM